MVPSTEDTNEGAGVEDAALDSVTLDMAETRRRAMRGPKLLPVQHNLDTYSIRLSKFP
jgi:hypothetical protein